MDPYLISGETLAGADHTLTFQMTSIPSRIGPLDIAGADGEMLTAGSDGRTYLRFRIDPLGGTARAEVQAARAPAVVSVNGQPLPYSDWFYQPGEHLITLRNLPAGTVLLRFEGPR